MHSRWLLYLETDFDNSRQHRHLGKFHGTEDFYSLWEQFLDVAHQTVVYGAEQMNKSCVESTFCGHSKTREWELYTDGGGGADNRTKRRLILQSVGLQVRMRSASATREGGPRPETWPHEFSAPEKSRSHHTEEKFQHGQVILWNKDAHWRRVARCGQYKHRQCSWEGPGSWGRRCQHDSTRSLCLSARAASKASTTFWTRTLYPIAPTWGWSSNLTCFVALLKRSFQQSSFSLNHCFFLSSCLLHTADRPASETSALG